MRQHLAMHCRAGWSPLKKGMTCKAWMAITAGWKRSMAAWWWRWWRWILCFMFQRIEGKTMENLQKSTGCYSKFSHHPMRGMLALGLWIWDSGSNIIIWDDQNWKKQLMTCGASTIGNARWQHADAVQSCFMIIMKCWFCWWFQPLLSMFIMFRCLVNVYELFMSAWLLTWTFRAGKHHLGWPPGQTSGL